MRPGGQDWPKLVWVLDAKREDKLVPISTCPIPPVKQFQKKGMAGLAWERNRSVATCNIKTDDSGDVRPGARQTGLNGAIVVPIRDKAGTARGALGIGVQREYEYTAEETAELMRLGAELLEDASA